MKVFLSHQKLDSGTAGSIASRLRQKHGIDSYLDVIDPYIGQSAEDLANHIRSQMGSCTQLLAVVSSATKASQWVPWEIGVASEKEYPLATFSGTSTLPPEFLQKWPYLRTMEDVDAYAKASIAAQTVYRTRKSYLSESASVTLSTKSFFSDLRARLNQ